MHQRAEAKGAAPIGISNVARSAIAVRCDHHLARLDLMTAAGEAVGFAAARDVADRKRLGAGAEFGPLDDVRKHDHIAVGTPVRLILQLAVNFRIGDVVTAAFHLRPPVHASDK